MSTSNNENKPNESKLKLELKAYHKKTLELFASQNLDLPYDVKIQKMRVDDFLRRAKEDKAPIQKIITYMKRIPKVVRDEKGIAIKKDFLEVHSELNGIDWKDNPLRVTDCYDGFYYEPIINTTTGDRDPETGDFKMNREHQGNRQVHDIEITEKNRKQIISDFIEGATGTYLDNIRFYLEVPDSNKGLGFRCGIYTYDQFINSSIDELENLARITPSPINLHSNKDRKGYMG
jgi:hypothetical protein